MKLRFTTWDGNTTLESGHAKKLVDLLNSNGFKNVKIKKTRSWPSERHSMVEAKIDDKDIERFVHKMIADLYFAKYPDDRCI